ncbi:V-set domain-containing T-cell activation inhibitor 1 [Larimichthys crocea]|uniref:Uncharacterized protein n=1 Tax=Larimichthys crocea TaxID=215358 RepID=A0ACD3Q528_LARCR|nr:V-set domain-containing T-cell activation inhibitor 1 [Larimichthys crocea]
MLVVHVSTVESEAIASKTIELRSGEDVILPCNLARSYDMQSLRVEWTRDGKEVHLYREGNDDLSDQDKGFKGRTSLFREEMANGISTGAIVAIAVIIVIVAGVGLFLLVKNRKIKMCSGQRRRQQSMEENNDVRMNLNNMRNDDPADR